MQPEKVKSARLSYLEAIHKLGYTDAEVQAMSNQTTDECAVEGSFEIRESPIHGLGVFATNHFGGYMPVGFGRVDNKRSQLGKYVNHSDEPNCRVVQQENGDVVLMSSHWIQPGEELTLDYYASFLESRPRGRELSLDVTDNAAAEVLL